MKYVVTRTVQVTRFVIVQADNGYDATQLAESVFRDKDRVFYGGESRSQFVREATENDLDMCGMNPPKTVTIECPK